MPAPRPLLALFAVAAWAHAPITPALAGPLRTEGARIVDSTGAIGQLRGAVLPDVDAATTATLGVMRRRWNFNAVRIPVRVADWQRDGRAYLDLAAAAVARAREAELAVILVAEESTPSAATRAFWTACATQFRDSPNVIFSLFRQAPAGTDPAVWQDLFNAIRATGARQIVASPVGATITGENILYEAIPAVGGGNVFGNLPGRVPVYAGEWGLTDCSALPLDPRAVSDLVFTTLYDFDDRGISWTASDFTPGGLLLDAAEYEPASFTPAWRCGQPGMGQTVLTWMTGDPIGFGYLRKEAISSAAGGPSSPASPGQLLSLYIEQMGPAPDQFGRLDATGKLPAQLGGTTVLFDGEPAPILFAGQYQINVQAPRTLTPGTETLLQVIYRGVPSNRLRVEVVPAAPEIFHDGSRRNAIALNENGSPNSTANPAAPGSIIVLFATGTGLTAPTGTTGQPAPSPHPVLTQPATLSVNGLPAEVLFAGEAPGFIGLSQINARLPRQLTAGSASLILGVGDRKSQAPVTLSVRP